MALDINATSKEYFSNLNTLAKKIAVDVENTREAYQDYWHSLSRAEQDQVIDESIITPSALIKYANLNIIATEKNPNVHSWFTSSQLNLYNQFDVSRREDHYETMNRVCSFDKSNEESNGPKSKQTINPNSKALNTHRSSISKPKNPPPPPPAKNQPTESEVLNDIESSPSEMDAAGIPKTGFDFLDNW